MSQFIEDKSKRDEVLKDFLSDNPTALKQILSRRKVTEPVNLRNRRSIPANSFQENTASGVPQIGYLLLTTLKSEDDDHAEIIKLNKGVDVVLGIMNGMFADGGLSVELPNINKTFGHGIMAGTFTASNGNFENPGTLQRTGDVSIFKNDGAVGLEVALGLQVLRASYDHYDVKILKIHQNGDIKVSIAQNSLKMKITLNYSPNCHLNVDYVEVDQLDGIKVDISGLGAFQSMFNMLSKWLLDNFTHDFKNIVNQKLMEKAKKAVAKEDICKYFPF
ncbi:unnamed protein product [Nesidiocoris tenuis]|uniref:Lipid-binding serum glycoprotein N-terminal domain-containing protein n=1 Tax=Nesidiocoris tenuis TaxID=355587 RepID=A0A6H5HQD4_9HEMI|nr:unnamed protein product [Nesidiocoris tenuis]